MRKVKRAQKAFEDFSGHKPKRVRTSRLPDKSVTGWEMGPVVGIAYQAKRDGKTRDYFHEFKPAARPSLVSKDDGSQLYIDGGRYKVTERGIEDMPALFVVNPSARSGAKAKRKPMARRRTATRRKRRTSQVAVFRANPIRRRRRRVSARRRVFARNPSPIRRRRRRSVSVRRFRRNPSSRRGFAMPNLGKLFIPAIGIGFGAVGAEIIMGYLPIPATFKTGVLRHVTKGVVAVTAGLLIGKVLKQKKLGNFIALGGVVIAAHDALKEVITSKMPAIPFGYYSPAGAVEYSAMGEYLPRYVGSPGMGQYVPTVNGSLGESPEFQA